LVPKESSHIRKNIRTKVILDDKGNLNMRIFNLGQLIEK